MSLVAGPYRVAICRSNVTGLNAVVDSDRAAAASDLFSGGSSWPKCRERSGKLRSLIPPKSFGRTKPN